MHLCFHLPLLGDVTVHFDADHLAGPSSAARPPERLAGTPPAPFGAGAVSGATAHSDRPEAAGEERPRGHVPVEPRDLVFAVETHAAVDAHLADASFGVGALAEVLGVSRSNLYRRLGASLGQTPQRLIRERRLRRAAQLLDARAGRIGEVADAVGYRSTAQFSRAFRDRFGMPPSSYAACGGAREAARA